MTNIRIALAVGSLALICLASRDTLSAKASHAAIAGPTLGPPILCPSGPCQPSGK